MAAKYLARRSRLRGSRLPVGRNTSGCSTGRQNNGHAWAMMTLLFMMIMMGLGAAALEMRFRIYTIATWIVFIVIGVLTGMESPGIEANLPTPHIGLWERINIGAFMMWIIVLAVVLLYEKNIPGSNKPDGKHSTIT